MSKHDLAIPFENGGKKYTLTLVGLNTTIECMQFFDLVSNHVLGKEFYGVVASVMNNQSIYRHMQVTDVSNEQIDIRGTNGVDLSLSPLVFSAVVALNATMNRVANIESTGIQQDAELVEQHSR